MTSFRSWVLQKTYGTTDGEAKTSRLLRTSELLIAILMLENAPGFMRSAFN